jgi:beta-galactosidase GanA
MATREQVNAAIKAFADAARVDGLALDEQDSCSVLIRERIDVDLIFDEAGERLVIETPLGFLPETGRTDLMLRLAQANRLGVETRGGTLAMGPDDGIVLMRELPHAEFDYPLLEKALVEQIETADRFMQVIEIGAKYGAEMTGMLDPTRMA